MNLNTQSTLRIALPVAVVYFAGAHIGHLFSLVNSSVSMVWPAAGIALAAVLRYGNAAAWGVLIGVFTEEFMIAGLPLLVASSIALSATAAAMLGAWGMQARSRFQIDMQRIHDAKALLYWGVLGASVFSAVTGIAALSVAGIVPWQNFWKASGFWIMGDSLGILLLTPLLLQLTGRNWRLDWSPAYTAWILAVAAICLLVFADIGEPLLGTEISPLLLFPLIVLGAQLFTLNAVHIGLLLIVVGAFGSYLAGIGHYAHLYGQVSIQPWLMVSSLAVCGLTVSAGNAQRISAERLASSRKLHAWLADSERPLPDMLDALCREVTDQLPHAACAIAVLEPESQALRATAYSGDIAFGDAYSRVLTRNDSPERWYAAATPGPEELPLDPVLHAAMHAAGYSGVHCIPIENGAETLGIVCAFIPGRLDAAGKRAVEHAAHQGAMLILRKRDEHALRQRQAERDAERALLRSLIDANPDLIFVKDSAGRYQLCNRTFEEYADQAEAELLGKTDLEVFGEAAGTPYREQEQRMLRANGILRNEEWITYPGGRRALLDTLKAPLHDAHGNIQGVVGICRDITQHRELEKELVSVTENRQRSVGQDLHDNLGQRLVGVAYLAKTLEQQLLARDDNLAKSAAIIVEHTQTTIVECKRLAQGLVPVEIESNGLMAALRTLAARTASTFGIVCEFDCQGEVLINDMAISLNLYRIAQEAANNAVRHGKAKHIVIMLVVHAGGIRLSVRDDGTGLPDHASADHAGMGIRIMHYRASLMGGTLQFLAPAEGGTEIVVALVAGASLPEAERRRNMDRRQG